MRIRPMTQADTEAVIALAIDVFGPFHEHSFRPTVGEVVFAHQDAWWRQEYINQIPRLHSPDERRNVALAEVSGQIVGFIAWSVGSTGSAEITHVAVSEDHRGAGLGSALCRHAFESMKSDGAEVVTIGTGGDEFHAPARMLYESLGCTPFPQVTYYRTL